MALYMNLFNSVTLGAGATAFYNWGWNDATDHGPNYISASFQGAESNYGTATTTQTSVVSSYDDSHGYYWPIGIGYRGQIRNDSGGSIIIKVNIGTFQ